MYHQLVQHVQYQRQMNDEKNPLIAPRERGLSKRKRGVGKTTYCFGRMKGRIVPVVVLLLLALSFANDASLGVVQAAKVEGNKLLSSTSIHAIMQAQ